MFCKPFGNGSCGLDVFKNRFAAQGNADGVVRLRQAQFISVSSLQDKTKREDENENDSEGNEPGGEKVLDDGFDAKEYFELLKLQEEEIEKELGFELEWQDLPNRKASRITVALTNANPSDKDDWTRQHE